MPACQGGRTEKSTDGVCGSLRTQLESQSRLQEKAGQPNSTPAPLAAMLSSKARLCWAPSCMDIHSDWTPHSSKTCLNQHVSLLCAPPLSCSWQTVTPTGLRVFLKPLDTCLRSQVLQVTTHHTPMQTILLIS